MKSFSDRLFAKPFIHLWLIVLLVKLILALWIPLSPDEAYYWVWSNKLDWSYYDHPPMIAFLFFLGHKLEFLGNAVRWPAVIFGHLTFLIWYHIAKPILSTKQMRVFLMLFLFTPLLGPGSLILTPDLPLMVFFSLSVWLFLKWWNQPNWGAAALLGLSLGLGFTSKYMIVLFFPALILFLFLKRGWKRLRWGHVALAAVTFLIGAAPVLYWNWQHDWVSFLFQANHGLGKSKRGGFREDYLLEYLVSQIILLFPFILYQAFKKRPNPQTLWIWCFAVTPLAFFLLTSFRKSVEANWPIMATPFILLLAILHSPEALKGVKRVTQFWIVAFFIVLTEIAFHWMPKSIYKKTDELIAFNPIVNFVQEKINSGEDPSKFFARSYQMAAIMSYRTKHDFYKLHGFNRRDFFDEQEQSKPTGPIYYLILRKTEGLPRIARERGDRLIGRTLIDENHWVATIQLAR